MQEIRKINDFYEMIEHDKVLVIFYADWSGPADILLQVTEDLKEELKSYEVVKVNTDKLMQITRKYHITSVPALKVFKNNIRVIWSKDKRGTIKTISRKLIVFFYIFVIIVL